MITEKKYTDRSSSEGEEELPFISNSQVARLQKTSALSKAFYIILSSLILIALTLAVICLSLVVTRSPIALPASCSVATKPTSSNHIHEASSVEASPSDGSGPDGHIDDCGASIEEAFKKGCIYDSMLPGWTPPRCYNRTLELEYRGDWKWYTTRDAHHEVSWSLVETGRYGELWANDAYHKKRCLYMWRKTALALDEEGSWINGVLLKSSFTDHCLAILDGREIYEDESALAKIRSRLLTCRRVNSQGLKSSMSR